MCYNLAHVTKAKLILKNATLSKLLVKELLKQDAPHLPFQHTT